MKPIDDKSLFDALYHKDDDISGLSLSEQSGILDELGIKEAKYPHNYIAFNVLKEEILKEDDPILIRVEGGNYGEGHMMTIIGYFKLPWIKNDFNILAGDKIIKWHTFYIIRDTAVPLGLHCIMSESNFENHAKSTQWLTEGESYVRGNPFI